MSDYVAEKIKENINKLPFKDFFGSDVSLVPAPRSSLMNPGMLWIPEKIVKAMSILGLGEPYPCLTRIQPVRKAAYCKSSADRPKALDHYNTIQCQQLVHRPIKLIIIDDVITSGSTLLGCASKLKDIFPDVPIQSFAVLRTMSDPNDFTKIEEPCTGDITLRHNGQAHREP